MSNTTNESGKMTVAVDQLDPPQNNQGYYEGKKSRRSRGGSGAAKRPWTRNEDAILIEYVKNYGSEKWDEVKKRYKLDRTGKSCRFRYINYLDPKLKQGPFTLAEEQLIFRLHAKFGNQWALIARELPGRRDNQIKNFWNTRNKKHERKYSWPPDPHTLPAQLYIKNPTNVYTQSDEIQCAANVNGGNPLSFFLEGYNPPSYGGPSLDSFRNIVPSQDLGSQARGFSTRLQANTIFSPGSLHEFSGKSSIYGKNIVSTGGGGGAISDHPFLANNNYYSTFGTSLGTKVAELPSLQGSKIQHHDIYSFPEEAVPIQWDSRFAKNMFQELLQEADEMTFRNTVDNFEPAYPMLDEFSNLNFFPELSDAPVFNEPTTRVSYNELPSSQGHPGMEIMLADMQRETSDALPTQKLSTDA